MLNVLLSLQLTCYLASKCKCRISIEFYDCLFSLVIVLLLTSNNCKLHQQFHCHGYHLIGLKLNSN